MDSLVAEKRLTTEEKILDAAEHCFERFGIAKTTVKDVAQVAGVSHMTIYRKFTDRDALFAATSLRLLDRRWSAIAARLSSIDTLGDWLLEALLANWRLMQEERTLARYDHVGVLEEGMKVLLSEPGIACVSRQFDHLLDVQGRGGKVHAGDIAEWLHWMSYVMATGSSPRLQTEKDWRRWLGRQIKAGVIQR